MITFNRHSVILAAVALLALTWAMKSTGVAEEKPNNNTDQKAVAVMRAKLANSQKVIEGLVTEDFELIRQAAQRMGRMSQAANWPTAKDSSYEHYQDAFRRDCEKLDELAEDENLTGAHYAYLQLATTCINCHEYVRRSFSVRRDKSDPNGPVMLIPNHWEEPGNRKSDEQKSSEKHVQEAAIQLGN